ncbi:MAG: HAD family hydrolase [Hespellia sp.]|nr:HAD family hydrolase [Hespellia sp.]
MYHTILFDLDGTLTDPGEGITKSVAYALHKWGIEVKDRTTLYKFIGPPLIQSFEKFYGFSSEKAMLTTSYFQEYFRDKGIFENEIYPDTQDLLQKLKASGKKLMVATSKPEEFAVRVLEYFQIDSYFDVVAGAMMDETRTKKSEVIAYALEKAGVTDLSGLVMIGDREHDVIGAKEVGIDSIGVLYGYGDRAELEQAGATYIAENATEILSLTMEF